MNKTPYFQLIAFVIAIGSFHQGFTQKKALPGYYITLQGDTVRGTFPYYAQWTKNPAQVDFIPTGETHQTELTPENTRQFTVNGYDEYVAYTGKRLVNPIDNNILLSETFLRGIDDESERITVFLRLVIATTGGNLYIFHDTKRMNFFYQATGQPVIELRYKKTLDLKQISEMPEYRQQLSAAFAAIIERKHLAEQLEKLKYTEQNLSSFFKTMFPVVKEEARYPNAPKWILSGGVMATTIHADLPDQSPSLLSQTRHFSYSPLLSVGCIVPIGRNFGKYFAYPQLKLYQYKNTMEAYQDPTVIHAITCKADVVAVIEAGGGCNFINHENFKCFASAGIGLLLQPNATLNEKVYRASDHATLGNMAIGLPGLFYSTEVSAGVVLNKKMLISVTYKLPSKDGDFEYLLPVISGTALTVGYIF